MQPGENFQHVGDDNRKREFIMLNPDETGGAFAPAHDIKSAGQIAILGGVGRVEASIYRLLDDMTAKRKLLGQFVELTQDSPPELIVQLGHVYIYTGDNEVLTLNPGDRFVELAAADLANPPTSQIDTVAD